jgi:hypothetical protein
MQVGVRSQKSGVRRKTPCYLSIRDSWSDKRELRRKYPPPILISHSCLNKEGHIVSTR